MAHQPPPPPQGWQPGQVPPPPRGYPVAVMQSPGPAPGVEYASFWRRLGGYLIDGFILAIPTWIIFFVAFAALLASAVIHTQTNGNGVSTVTSGGAGFAFGAFFLFFLIIGAIYAAYFTLMVSMTGSTVGQKAVDVRVVREEDGGMLPLGRALARSTVFWVGAVIWLLPFIGWIIAMFAWVALLWVAWDPHKQGLHDKLGRAYVIHPLPVLTYVHPGYGYPPPAGYAPPSPPPYPPPGQTPPPPPVAPQPPTT